ncbi:MAG: S9 family peptidase [Candidatus Marinimicrobia bacterium]|nr:S9 family peptidase [Candidatus Neomarinimicrobiota bacterium]
MQPVKSANYFLGISSLLMMLFLFSCNRESSSHVPALTVNDYSRAEQFLPWNTYNMVFGDKVTPRFLNDHEFWFRSHKESGYEFVIVDAIEKSREPVFDHNRLASTLSVLMDTTIEGYKLPFHEFKFLERNEAIQFFVSDSIRWECDILSYNCTGPDTVFKRKDWERPSPDRRWLAFERDENLWVRNIINNQEKQLSFDGIKDHGYAVVPEGCCREITDRRSGNRIIPPLKWSPDSRKIITHRYDERNVKSLHLLEADDGRPILHSYKYAMPGDSVIPTSEAWVFDVEDGTSTKVRVNPQPGGSYGRDTVYTNVQWTANSNNIFYTTRSRNYKNYSLFDVDASTGQATEILEEKGATFVELNQFTRYRPAWRVIGNGEEFIWWSERDGWGHLYLYDGSGKLKNRITSGAWVVTDVIYVDLEERKVYFTATGKEENVNPYYQLFYRANLDGSNLELLSNEKASHKIIPFPSGKFFIDQYSTPDIPPISLVRSSNGEIIFEFESSDISRLIDAGWKPPLTFDVKGRDGITDLYGLLWFPSNFDPDRSYPVIDYIYPGPQVGSVTLYTFSANGRGNARALSELGFIVFAIDAFGTPMRSKSFHDAYYENMGDNGLPDHISGIKQLALKYPQIDLNHVGIYGHSGGGFSSTDAILRHPDFFKVAVSGAGNHDNRGYHFSWGEKYQGLLVSESDSTDNYDNQANQNIAHNLKGKLLLHYGTLDDNVHPNMTHRVIEELIKSNKDFELIVLPNRNHSYGNEPYIIRRTWDYFVEHLLNVEPPFEFQISEPNEEYKMERSRR